MNNQMIKFLKKNIPLYMKTYNSLDLEPGYNLELIKMK